MLWLEAALPMDTRTRILKAATKLLRKGPAEVRMEDVAKAADVSRQAVYLHFENRTALLVAATGHLDDELGFQERIQPILEARSGSQALDRMAEFLGAYLPIVSPLIDAFTAGRSTDPAIQAAFKDRTAHRRGGCKQIIAWLVRDKDLAKDLDPETAEELLMGLTSYELWREWVVAGQMSSEQYVTQLKRLLRQALMR